MDWSKIMDQKDLLLLKARGALLGTKALLEKILQDDDDAVLSARVIGETGDDEAMNTETQEQETPIQRLRRETFAMASDLSYRITPEQAERFYDELILSWSPYPARNRGRIFEFFRDARYEYPDLPINPRSTAALYRYSDDVRIRVDAICVIICLFEDLYDVDPNNLTAMMRKSRQRYERHLRKHETEEETLRRHAFSSLEKLTGKSLKQIEKIYDAIDWKNPVRWDEPSRTGRFAGVYEFLFADVPERVFYRREAKNAAEHEQRLAYGANVTESTNRARALAHPVIKTFEDLRAEIGRANQRRAVKTAEKSRLERIIARTKEALAAHSRAA